MPPISTLLESADRAAPPPPPVPESRNYYALEQRERELRNNIEEMRSEAARLGRQARDITARATGSSLLPPEWDEWSTIQRRAYRDAAMSSYRDSSSDAQTAIARADHLAPPTSWLPHSPLHRSPEPLASNDRPHSHGQTTARRSNLPTPPADASDDGESLFLPDPANIRRASNRRSHPLSHSWRPESPINGLGDRNRSPTPNDGWEVMRATIASDPIAPSADSSFTSAAASNSFSSNADTAITEPDGSDNSRRGSADDDHSDSVSSVDAENLVCNDDEMIDATEQFAQDMYFTEMETPAGRERIAAQQRIRDGEGNRFALADEPASVDIGFRLIEDALESDEGRQRVMHLRGHDGPRDVARMVRFRDTAHRRTRGAHTVDGPLSPHPERYGQTVHDAASRTRRNVHEYFDRATSPPPRYSPLGSHPDVNTFTSRDGPQPHPVSPPTARSEREVSDMLLRDLDSDSPDLDATRRVIERLARRDDVPEEWWMSMGLNFSRTRPRTQPRRPSPDRAATAAGERVRSGRVGRGNSRL